MRSSKDLFLLIKSLTKAEKKYITGFSANHVLGSRYSYMRLFTEIENFKNEDFPDENILKVKLEKQGIKNFEFTKNYLYNIILRSLMNYHFDSSIDNKIKNNIRYIEILYDKGLYSSSKKILEKTLKQAYEIENLLTVIQILRWKKNLIFEGAYGGNEQFKLEEVGNEEQKMIETIKNLNEFKMLSNHTWNTLSGKNPNYRGEKIKTEIRKIIKNPLLKSVKMALSYHSLMYYYQILAYIYESLGIYKESYIYWTKLIATIEEHPRALKKDITNYIAAVCNILGPCLNLKLFNELENNIFKLKSLIKNYPKNLYDNDKISIFIYTLIYDLRQYICKGEFSTASGKIPFIEIELEKFKNKILNEYLLQIYYLIGYIFLGTGEYSAALSWNNKILNNIGIYHKSKIYIKSKIVNLILHYELGNYELIEYLIKQDLRNLKETNFDVRVEKTIIKCINKLLNTSQNNVKLNILKENHTKIKSYLKKDIYRSSLSDSINRFEVQNSFIYCDEFDIICWLEKMISGKSFEEIVKRKVK